MKAYQRTTFIVTLTLYLAFALASVPGSAQSTAPPLQVVTTFSVLYDIVKNVGGDRVEVYTMVPLGTDPHEYTPLPRDIQAATRADVVFWNGLNLETGDGWFTKLMSVARKDIENGPVYALSEGVEPLYLTDGVRKEINPHAFLSIAVGIKYTENARNALMEVDPEHAAIYERNAAAYIAELEQLHQEYVDRIAEIPAERRILVTSERAFQYMAADYGLLEGYVWEIDTDEQGSPLQIVNLVRFVREHKVPVLFLESNVDPRPMETVSRETGVPIFDRKIYSDEIGRPGSPPGTYLGALKWNIDAIYEGLMQP